MGFSVDDVKALIKAVLAAGHKVSDFSLMCFLDDRSLKYVDLLSTEYLIKDIDFRTMTLPGINRMRIPLFQYLVRECKLDTIKYILQQVPEGMVAEFVNKEGDEKSLYGPILFTYFKRLNSMGYQADNLELFKLLVGHGANLDVVDIDGMSPLSYLSKRLVGLDVGNDMPTRLECIVDFLVAEGVVNISEMFDQATTMLRLATVYFNKDMVRILLKYGADVREKDDNGDTLLHALVGRAIA